MFLQDGWSPLLNAALIGNRKIVDILLKAGAVVDLTGPVSTIQNSNLL